MIRNSYPLGTISVHNFIKISLLKTYIATNNLYVTCLSETYLDSSISNDDGNLEIPGYDLFRADHPSNTKRGGVCIYYRNSLPLKILNIQYLHECINFEIRIGGKLCRFVSLHCSQSQSQDDFESFVNNFELNIGTATAHNIFKPLFLLTLMLSQIFGLRAIRQYEKVLKLMVLPLHLDYNK